MSDFDKVRSMIADAVELAAWNYRLASGLDRHDRKRWGDVLDHLENAKDRIEATEGASMTAPFTRPSLLSMPWSSAEECRAQQEIAYMAYCDERDRFEVSTIQAARNRSKSHPLSANRAERRRASRSL